MHRWNLDTCCCIVYWMSEKKEVYCQLYKTLKTSGVAAGKKTLVYPLWVREGVAHHINSL